MAKVFLESTDTSFTVSNSNTQVYGTSGDQSVIIAASATGVEVDQNVEGVAFAGNIGDFTFHSVGATLQVFAADGLTLIAEIPLQLDANGTTVQFADTTFDAKLQTSGADFFFLVSSVNFMIPHNGAGGHEFSAGKDEAWTSLLDEREELIEFFDRLGKPVFILTADLHNSFAVKITDRVWEFSSGPLNSVNHVPANDEGGRPATGLYRSGPRTCDIRWSSYILPDLERPQRLYPYYCVVQINNVYNLPQQLGGTRWVAYPHPQVIFQYFDGRTGDFVYAEAISTPRAPKP